LYCDRILFYCSDKTSVLSKEMSGKTYIAHNRF
jgi:hypothetical protein